MSPPTHEKNDDDSDSSVSVSSSSTYEPEYEWEDIALFYPSSGDAIDNEEKEEGCHHSLNHLPPTLRIQVVIPPPVEYLSSLRANDREISGRSAWCGSILLARTLWKNASLPSSLSSFTSTCKSSSSFRFPFVKDRTVLELGAGTGLLGMVALLLGASQVAITDGDPEAVDLLCSNLEENSTVLGLTLSNTNNLISSDLPLLPSTSSIYHSLSEPNGLPSILAAVHLWGKDEIEQLREQCQLLLGHGHEQVNDNQLCLPSDPIVPPLSSPQPSVSSPSLPSPSSSPKISFDLILAGDVLYKSHLPVPFYESVRSMLAYPGGTLLLCHVPRAGVGQKEALTGLLGPEPLLSSSLMEDGSTGNARNEDDGLFRRLEVVETIKPWGVEENKDEDTFPVEDARAARIHVIRWKVD